jgi:addiction module RelB/DinJ family antitoxin
MNDTVINIKTTTETKERARKVADDLGFNLSSLINAYLRELIRTKRVNFSLKEEPTLYLESALEQSSADVERGDVSPPFSDVDDAVSWLKGA